MQVFVVFLINWFADCLNARETFYPKHGVPQGSMFGLILCPADNNYIFDRKLRGSLTAFANDIAIIYHDTV